MEVRGPKVSSRENCGGGSCALASTAGKVLKSLQFSARPRDQTDRSGFSACPVPPESKGGEEGACSMVIRDSGS